MWKPGPPHSTTSSRCTSAVTSRHRHDGAMRHVADRARLAVVEHLRADARADAVGADQRRARRMLRPSAVRSRTPVAVDPRSRVTMASGIELDRRIAPAGVEQHVMQVDAMDDDVGMLEARAERRAGRDARVTSLAVERIAASARRAANRPCPSTAAVDAEPVEARETRWGRTGCRSRWRRTPARLPARARGGPGCAERERGGEAAEAAADDQDGTRSDLAPPPAIRQCTG